MLQDIRLSYNCLIPEALCAETPITQHESKTMREYITGLMGRDMVVYLDLPKASKDNNAVPPNNFVKNATSHFVLQAILLNEFIWI